MICQDLKFPMNALEAHSSSIGSASSTISSAQMHNAQKTGAREMAHLHRHILSRHKSVSCHSSKSLPQSNASKATTANAGESTDRSADEKPSADGWAESVRWHAWDAERNEPK